MDEDKTTTAVNLVDILAKKQDFFLVDSAPQKYATWWTERGEERMNFDVKA